MLSSNLLKFTVVSILLCASACNSCRTPTDATQSAPLVVGEMKTEIPFSTKEPDNFQTEIVVTTNGIEDKFFTAKSGANQLTIFDFQKKSEIRLLKIGANQNFLINPRRKIYVESESSAKNLDAEKDSLTEFLTAEWTNQKANAKFENLGAENNLTKFRLILNDSTNSEIIIQIDEKIGLPVKQEFYARNGEQKNLTLTIELKNFSLQPEAKFFELPKDFRKVSLKEFEDARKIQGEEK